MNLATPARRTTLLLTKQKTAADKATYTTPKSNVRPIGYRLPSDRIQELRDFFTAAESQMGLKTTFWQDLDYGAGVRGSPRLEDDVELQGAERWCQLPKRTRKAYARTRATLQALEAHHTLSLWRAYGPGDPNTRWAFDSEIAAIVPFTNAVEVRRLAMVDDLARDGIARAAAAGAKAGACARAFAEDSIRRGADAAVTRSRVIDDALAVAASLPRDARDVASMRRRSFISQVTAQAGAMLAEASKAYSAAWVKT